ncbi:DUF4936 family protein [Cognatazoarcus halotolerans]|uniref:DUF4936 family protein n=1 Tax=Zoogloeaceae TaxID=2008794 RepID=UPI00135849AF|nr:DUF4936 family protein [Cognatazoarcus halotolerans]MBX3680677.1 DUF4936 family protein [Rhodocyclaceae bacterium]MCB1901731.1 DUF4936 family protein [Rhodocyclaceae bacterium]MCP5308918.1 DUF4936 family protein [Zoogloeaceae bacterium]
MAVNLYVYYRVDPARAADMRAALRGAQARLGAAWRIDTGLLQRSDDPLTWMETYVQIEDPQGFLAALASELEAIGFSDCLAEGATRHVECFEPCA